MSLNQIKKIQNRIDKIKEEILNLGNLRAGSLTKQYNVCGKKKCKCKDPENPIKHGPYNQLAFYRSGKHSTRFIKNEILSDVKKEITNYKKLKLLVEELITISSQQSDIKIKDLKAK